MGFFTTRFVEVASVGITYRSCPRRAEGRNVSGPHLPARQAQEVEEVVAPGSGLTTENGDSRNLPDWTQ